ncbi:EcsC family protein [Kytococcus sp. Marseille-QA3725]
MGIFSRKSSKDQEIERRAAAAAQTEDPGMLDKAADALAHRLMKVGIDGVGPVDGAQKVAEDALVAAGGDRARAEDIIAKSHFKKVAGGGFVTGLGGLLTMPVALPANVVEFYLLTTRAVAAIAHLRGHDLTQPELRSAILLTLVGADARDILTSAGIPGTLVSGGRLASLASRQLPAPVLMVVNKAVGFRLLAQTGQKVLTRLGKAVPLAGGVIGAGLDVYLLNRILDHAREEFPHRTA